jgi:hypothetical protein
VVATENTTTTKDISLVIAQKYILISLTWGITPANLDAYFWEPPISGATTYLHNGTGVYRGCSSFPYSSCFARIDKDDTSKYGPEKVYIYTHDDGTSSHNQVYYPGNYRFVVNRVSSTPTSFSGAKVTITINGVVTATYLASAATGTLTEPWWHVLDFTMSTTTITTYNPVNQIVAANPGIPTQ